jgi:hypothetical protein
MKMPTKTSPDETVSVAGLDALGDNAVTGVVGREDRAMLRPVALIECRGSRYSPLVDALQPYRVARQHGAGDFRVWRPEYFPGVNRAQDLVRP